MIPFCMWMCHESMANMSIEIGNRFRDFHLCLRACALFLYVMVSVSSFSANFTIETFACGKSIFFFSSGWIPFIRVSTEIFHAPLPVTPPSLVPFLRRSHVCLWHRLSFMNHVMPLARCCAVDAALLKFMQRVMIRCVACSGLRMVALTFPATRARVGTFATMLGDSQHCSFGQRPVRPVSCNVRR